MRKACFLFTITFLFFSQSGLLAQDADTLQNIRPEKQPKRPWYLVFNFDLKAKSITGSFNDSYEGEYYADVWSGRVEGWQWAKKESSIKPLIPAVDYYNLKWDLMISRNRNFRFGLSYTLGILDGRLSDTTYFNISYLGISAIGEYVHYFGDEGRLNPFVFGSVALGPYRGTEEIEGKGTEIFAQGRAGAGLMIVKGWGFRGWASTDYLFYRETTMSPIFKRDMKIATNLNTLYIGFGITKEFMLIPD